MLVARLLNDRNMKKKYQNMFFLFGVVMLDTITTQLELGQVCDGMLIAGSWSFAYEARWAVLLGCYGHVVRYHPQRVEGEAPRRLLLAV